jgi:hypothetical protein
MMGDTGDGLDLLEYEDGIVAKYSRRTGFVAAHPVPGRSVRWAGAAAGENTRNIAAGSDLIRSHGDGNDSGRHAGKDPPQPA